MRCLLAAVLGHRFLTHENGMFGVELGLFQAFKNRWTATPLML